MADVLIAWSTRGCFVHLWLVTSVLDENLAECNVRERGRGGVMKNTTVMTDLTCPSVIITQTHDIFYPSFFLRGLLHTYSRWAVKPGG